MNRLSKCCFLIVDAHEDTRLLLETLFESEGATVQGAATGPDAIQQFALHSPDIVICDIALPAMNGYTLLQHIRTHDMLFQRRTRVIAVTAWIGDSGSNSTLIGEFDAWLMKPIDLDDLMTQVVRFTTHNRVWLMHRFSKLRHSYHKLQRLIQTRCRVTFCTVPN
jgi:CheY-like chemotaxis protein